MGMLTTLFCNEHSHQQILQSLKLGFGGGGFLIKYNLQVKSRMRNLGTCIQQ